MRRSARNRAKGYSSHRRLLDGTGSNRIAFTIGILTRARSAQPLVILTGHLRTLRPENACEIDVGWSCQKLFMFITRSDKILGKPTGNDVPILRFIEHALLPPTKVK